MGAQMTQRGQAHEGHAPDPGIGPQGGAAVAKTVWERLVLIAVTIVQDSRLSNRRKSGDGAIVENLVQILIVGGQSELQRRRGSPAPFAPRREAVVDLSLILLAGVEVGTIAAVAREAHGQVPGDPVATARRVQVAADISVRAQAEHPLAGSLRARLPSDD